MRSLPFFLISVLFLLLVSDVQANTSITVSNNGDGSNTSINVKQSTGGNYINGQEVTSNNGSSHTRIEVNGEVLVDESAEGGKETNISVKQEGGKKPEVKYEVKQNSAVVKQEVKNEKDNTEVKNEVKVKTSTGGNHVKVRAANSAKQESLIFRLESLFDKLRSIFSS